VGGFPVSWLLINGLGALLRATAIVWAPGLFAGARRWSTVPLMPAMQLLAAAIAIPAFSVLNVKVASGWRLATIVIGLAVINRLIRFASGGRNLVANPVAVELPVTKEPAGAH
jgi:hypothetical protein